MKEDSEYKIAGPRAELLGQIPSEDKFLTKTGTRRQAKPQHKFEYGLRYDVGHVRVAAKQISDNSYERDNDNKKTDGEPKISEETAECLPTA